MTLKTIPSVFMYAMNIQNDVIALVLRQNCKSKQVTDFIAWPSRCHSIIYIADVVEWSKVLDIRLIDWCCSVSMVWVYNPVEGRTKICQLKDLILTLFGLIFRRILYIYIKKSNEIRMLVHIYTYKHCIWRSATAVKTLVQECCEQSVLFFLY